MLYEEKIIDTIPVGLWPDSPEELQSHGRKG